MVVVDVVATVSWQSVSWTVEPYFTADPGLGVWLATVAGLPGVHTAMGSVV